LLRSFERLDLNPIEGNEVVLKLYLAFGIEALAVGMLEEFTAESCACQGLLIKIKSS
jgi:hypothetical protein